MTGCEGRCGIRLDAAGREVRVPPLLDDPRPTHTPARCRAIRAVREAVEEECPGWEVGVCGAGYEHRHLAVVVLREVDPTREQLSIAVDAAALWGREPAELAGRAQMVGRYIARRLAEGAASLDNTAPRSVNGTG